MIGPPEMRTPTLAGAGGAAIESRLATTAHYQQQAVSATDFAAAVVSKRFGISPCLARLVCELAAIGGRIS